MKRIGLIFILFLIALEVSGQCYVAVKTSGSNTFGLMPDGTLWCWGTNTYGQLGNGTNTPNYTKTQMGADQDWSQNFSVGTAVMAIKTNGSLWIWGCRNGTCGDGSSASQYLFPQQLGNDTWKWAISQGDNVLAIKTNGTLWAWGDNSYGQLGTGSSDETPIPAPIQVGTDSDWARVYTTPSGRASFAIKENGSLWSWGDGEFHILGYTSGSHLSPHLVDSGPWLTVSANENHVLAIKADGTLWGWGANSAPGFEVYYGNGSTDSNNYQSIPVQIGTDTQWQYINITLTVTVALKSDGTLWGWGKNNVGQIGDGTTITRYSPIQLGSDNDWLSLSGYFTNYALKTSHSLYKWGYNIDLGSQTIITPTPTANAAPCNLGQEDWQIPEPAFSYEGNILHVHFPDGFGRSADMYIADAVGQIVERKKLPEANDYWIDMSAYARGLYLLVFSDGLNRYTIKYIKQ